MTVVACLKWVDLRPEATVGGVRPLDGRFAGISEADQAALEWALRLAREGEDVVAVTAGPAGSDAALREALACGAHRAVRIDCQRHTASARVGAAIAQVARNARFVVCGDYSIDGGSGSVPAFIAAELGVAQALGLVALEAARDEIRAVRRLDGGRREVLSMRGQGVLSVEGSAASLRRASARTMLMAQRADIECIDGPVGHHELGEWRLYRPRPRVLESPAGTTLERLRGLLDSGASTGLGHADPIALEPHAAAAAIVDQLREWGYLGDNSSSR